MKPGTLARITDIISAAFILLFVYTAVSKIISHDNFLVILKLSPFIGPASSFISWAVPLTEIMVAILLLFPGSRLLGFAGATVLMVLFTTYIAYMLTSAAHHPCSCGGVFAQLSWKQHLWLNVILMITAMTAWFLEKFQMRLSR